MKILHTSDWHLGRMLYGRKRYDEFAEFLQWLLQTIEAEKVDVLLIAGDVFDTTTPSNRAQELYYKFLCSVIATCCRHVVVIGGNHDSPSFLNAPKSILHALQVHVVGCMTDDISDEVIVLSEDDKPKLIVCAVPYLRDRDLRFSEPGESTEEKTSKLAEGLKNHYAKVCAIAKLKQDELYEAGHGKVPLVAMGHLFTSNAQVVDGDGVRELYVGNLLCMDKASFPPFVDYCALGHLHVPQTVGGAENIRYSGSPIPMGYGEALQEKKVVVIDFVDDALNICELIVPRTQELMRIAGTLNDIMTKIAELKAEGSAAWLEIEYTAKEPEINLRENLEDAIAGTKMEIRRIKNKYVLDKLVNVLREDEYLDELEVTDVFERCLESNYVLLENRQGLIDAYNEILTSIYEQDVREQ